MTLAETIQFQQIAIATLITLAVLLILVIVLLVLNQRNLIGKLPADSSLLDDPYLWSATRKPGARP